TLEAAQVLVAVTSRPAAVPQRGRWAFPVLVDDGAHIHRNVGATDAAGRPAPAVFVTDRFREIYAAYLSGQGSALPGAKEILEWLVFVNIQCPECGVPEWPDAGRSPPSRPSLTPRATAPWRGGRFSMGGYEREARRGTVRARARRLVVAGRRVFSGVQPTGKLHLGNYLGAISLWVAAQAEHEAIFCIADLHALTTPEAVRATDLRAKVRETAAVLLACGIDPTRAILFVQSRVGAHAELAWLLSCVTPVGWLERMIQFKARSADLESVGTGLLAYPVLQAADILLYRADLVPVGE